MDEWTGMRMVDTRGEREKCVEDSGQQCAETGVWLAGT